MGTSSMKHPATKMQDEGDANGYRVTMPIVLQLHQDHHLLNRDAVSDQIQCVTPTMRRRAPKMKDEGDANGYRGRTPIVDRPLLNRRLLPRHRHQPRQSPLVGTDDNFY